MAYYCSECDRWWSYPVKKCIFCGADVQEVIETEYKVIGFTQIQVPSIENPKVPYFNYLLEDKNGNKIIIKSLEEHKIGDCLDLKGENEIKNVYKVGVVGTGQMGYGIAEYILKKGHCTIIKTRSQNDSVISKFKTKLSKDHTEGSSAGISFLSGNSASRREKSSSALASASWRAGNWAAACLREANRFSCSASFRCRPVMVSA